MLNIIDTTVKQNVIELKENYINISFSMFSAEHFHTIILTLPLNCYVANSIVYKSK